jgi:hypothetical protein
MTSPQQPAERPNGSFVKHTRIGFDARPMVSILVREDDPRNPDTPQRWRSVEGRSGWHTWEQLHPAGHNLGSLPPAINGQPAHRWLETARRQLDPLAVRGAAPLPGTSAALARSTPGAATPTYATGPSTINAAQPAHATARPAPAAGPHPGRAATTPAPARGVVRVPGPVPRR